MSKGRIEWVDIARGCAIILVVFAHCHIPTTLLSYIYSFHVPLFFILSGFLLKGNLNKSFSSFLKSKFAGLVIPYFFFSFVAYVYWYVTRITALDVVSVGESPGVLLNGILVAIRHSGMMNYSEALWFIGSLLFSEILFFVIYRFTKGDRILISMSLLVLAIIGAIYGTFFRTVMPWSLDTVPVAVVFIGFGFLLNDYYPKWVELKTRKINKYIVITLSLMVSLLFWHLNTTEIGMVDMYYSVYGSYILYFIAAFSGSIFVMLICENIIVRSKILSYVGRNSLVIYALHQKVIFGIIGILMFNIIGRVLPFSPFLTFSKLGNGLFYLTFTFLLLIPIIWFLNKYCSVLIGRNIKYKK